MMPARAPLRRNIRRAWIGVLALLTIGAGALALQDLRISSDISELLGDTDDPELAELSTALAQSVGLRINVLWISGDNSVATAQRLAHRLRQDSHVAWVYSGPDETWENTFYELYFPRRMYFAQEHVLKGRGETLKDALASGMGSLFRQQAPLDPLLLFARQLERIQAQAVGALSVTHGQIVTRDPAGAVLLVGLRPSSFDVSAQMAYQAALASSFEVARANSRATLMQSSIGRFAIAAQNSIQRDVSRISVVSFVCVVLLFALLFRQFWAVGVAVLPVVVGLGGALIVASLTLGKLHGMTLAFGATLIGVGVDYSIHVLFHMVANPNDANIVRKIRVGLLLGGATTIAGLSGLLWTSFPGMRDLALFGSFGVMGALASALWLVPRLAQRIEPRPLFTRITDWTTKVVLAMQRHTRSSLLVALAGTAWLGLGAWKVSWQDGLSPLHAPDPEILREDARVRKVVGAPDTGRVIFAVGNTLDEALERNDAIYRVLASEPSTDMTFRSLATWLPSARVQQQSLDTLRAWQRSGALAQTFLDAGFRPGAFAAFDTALQHPPSPLRAKDLMDTTLASSLEVFFLNVGQRVAVLTFVSGRPSQDVQQALSAVPGVRYFEQQTFLQRAYGRYRQQMLWLVAFGLGAVFLLIFLRYRRWAPALSACMPALAGALGVLGTAGWWGGQANLLHSAALVLVCSIGADYGVLMNEARSSNAAARGVALAGILAAGLTTVLGFGLLGLSAHPALASVGRSLAGGIVAALLVTPAVFAWGWRAIPQPSQ